MPLGHLHHPDPVAVRLGEPHLHQPPGLPHGRPEHLGAPGRQLGVDRGRILDLEPQLDPGRRGPVRVRRAPGQFEEAAAGKQTVPRSGPVPNPRWTGRAGVRPQKALDRSGSTGRTMIRLLSTCTMRQPQPQTRPLDPYPVTRTPYPR